MKTLEEIKKEYEGFDIYLLPKFVKKVTGIDKDGMLFAGMAVNLDELLESTISQTKQELIEEILKQIKKEWKWAKDNGAPEQNFEMIINMLTPIKLSNK